MTLPCSHRRGALAALLLPGLAACGGGQAAGDTATAPAPAAAAPEASYDRIPRDRFNRLALRLDMPVYWVADRDADGAVDPDEVSTLLFYGRDPAWVQDGRFTPGFEQAYATLVAEAEATAPEDARLRAVIAELDNTSPVLLLSDLRELPDAHRAFAARMLKVAAQIDDLYAKQVGLASVPPADDPPSRSLHRRNWGIRCQGAATESDADCSAAAVAGRPYVGIYPQALQAEEGFCQRLAARQDGEALLQPFVVVQERGGELEPVPYHEAWPAETAAIADELTAAADAMDDPAEEALVAYLRAAAQAFRTDDWETADEAWAAMSAQNSRWYLRVGPDEVYWDPCSRKAGYHLTLARINPDSLAWQEKLTPLRQDMEAQLGRLAGPAYRPRRVSFKIPDFIDIVVNAGDDRKPFGATIGQSLPNWGRVTEEGRGRTVAMTNLYQDPESQRRRREVAETLLTAESLAPFSGSGEMSLLATILHEAMHNLGPAHEYRHRGRTAAEAFGGPMASMLEELKAQTGALYFVEYLRDNDLLAPEALPEAYLDSFLWALGHVSRGMRTATGEPKPYSQLAAIQVGFLIDEGAVVWDAEATAANGADRGAFRVDWSRVPEASRKLMKQVLEIKGRNQVDRARALVERYVDGSVVPHDTIVERHRRFPQTTFLYAVEL